MDNNKIKYLMWANKYVGNSLLFWREGKSGYTTDVNKSHQFTYEEALEIQECGGGHKMIPIDHCLEVSTQQVHADHLNRSFVGKEVDNG